LAVGLPPNSIEITKLKKAKSQEKGKDSHFSTRNFTLTFFFFLTEPKSQALSVSVVFEQQTMPGFSLEEPYPLATFKSTASASVGQSFCVDALPIDACAPAADSSEPDNAVESNLVAVTVQGEAIKLYNVRVLQFVEQNVTC
jgi:hypothetical protein